MDRGDPLWSRAFEGAGIGSITDEATNAGRKRAVADSFEDRGEVRAPARGKDGDLHQGEI
jgi:hypothetical protein